MQPGHAGRASTRQAHTRAAASWPRGRGRRSRLGARLLDDRQGGRDHLGDIADHAEVHVSKSGRQVVTHGDDVGGGLHAHRAVDRAGDAQADVQVRGDVVRPVWPICSDRGATLVAGTRVATAPPRASAGERTSSKSPSTPAAARRWKRRPRDASSSSATKGTTSTAAASALARRPTARGQGSGQGHQGLVSDAGGNTPRWGLAPQDGAIDQEPPRAVLPCGGRTTVEGHGGTGRRPRSGQRRDRQSRSHGSPGTAEQGVEVGAQRGDDRRRQPLRNDGGTQVGVQHAGRAQLSWGCHVRRGGTDRATTSRRRSREAARCVGLVNQGNSSAASCHFTTKECSQPAHARPRQRRPG